MNKSYISQGGAKMTLVESTNIHAIGYISPTKTLEVHFINGTGYTFNPFTPEGFNLFLHSESKGKFFAEHVKNNPAITATKCGYAIDIKKTITMAQKEKAPVADSFSKFTETVESIKVDYDKFKDKGVKASAKRARKALMELTKLCKTLRAELLGKDGE